MHKKKIPSAKSKPPKLADKPVVESQETVEALTHPPNLPLRPYLDDIWNVLDGISSAGYAPIASPTFTGTVVLPSTTSIGGVSSTELGFIDGLTSSAQTQLDGKQDVLISSVNLKTVNGNTLLGAGDVVIAAGTGDMILAAAQTVMGDKTFEDGTLLLRNVGNTFNGQFVNTNLADRVYTLKDSDGTLAFTTDITGTNSGTNTGDQTSIVGITGSLAEFNTALTGADFATGGGTATGTNTGDNAVNSNYSGLVSNATHTGDATGATALTVVGINSTLLSGLATGILKNTTTSGVPSIAVAGDFPTLNQNTTGTANIAGGTAGAIPYQSGAGATTVLAATATANKLLVSGASAAPTWSTPTFPNASATTDKYIKSDGTNWVASTETIAAPGTTGNVLTSDGTNWLSSTPATTTSLYSTQFNLASGTGALVDSETRYLLIFGAAAATTGTTSTSSAATRYYVHQSCTVKIARVFEVLAGTAGTNESWSWYIRVNATTDTLIEAVSSSSTGRVWVNTALSIALVAGDFFEVKSINPAWATNPNNIYAGVVWIQNS